MFPLIFSSMVSRHPRNQLMSKKTDYPEYQFSETDAINNLVRFALLNKPGTYPFDHHHSHNYNEVLVFLKGGGNHNISFQDNPVLDHSIHLLAANDVHWIEREKDSYGFAIVYKDQFLHKLESLNTSIPFSSCFTESRIINLTSEEAKRFSLLFQEMQDNTTDTLYLLNLAGAFLTRIATSFLQQTILPRSNDPLALRYIELVNTNFRKHLKAAEYAALLHVSTTTLQKRIKQSTGHTCQHFKQERLLKEAKKLLVQEVQHIQEISDDLGFEEPAHFSNWFSKQTGNSPSSFSKAL